jgi:hypothetical protein
VLLLIFALLALRGIRGDAPALLGVPRHLALGVAVAILSVAHILSGVLLAVLGSRLYGVLGAISSTRGAMFIFMISATGTISIDLMSLFVVAVPIIVWVRVSKFLAAIPPASMPHA